MKNIIILIYFFTFTLSFSQLDDKINLLKEVDKIVLNERINEFEKKFEVRFYILITKDEVDFSKYTVKGEAQKVLIVLRKNEDTKKIKVGLYFSKDIDIMGYKDEIDNMLNDSKSLIDSENYLDLIYELTGNTAEIVNMIRQENESIIVKNEIKRKVVILLIIILFLTGTILFLYSKVVKRRNIICKQCKIEMEVVDEYEDGKNIIKLYNCHVCGNSKKISYRQ